MSKKLSNELLTVQKPLIKYAVEAGWKYIPSADAVPLRQGESGIFFCRILSDKLIELNHGLVTSENVNEIVERLESVSNTIEGNAEILGWLRGEKSIYD
ncbi:type I restriction endonuclease subunit R, partial [Candidatus Desantisbacteria bacterium]|nr:type I restriction endonuclease subunit R [Candidatus Desantisbacteria bacterium]